MVIKYIEKHYFPGHLAQQLADMRRDMQRVRVSFVTCILSVPASALWSVYVCAQDILWRRCVFVFVCLFWSPC